MVSVSANAETLREHIRIILYGQSTYDTESFTIDALSEVLRSPKYSGAHPSVLYIPGYKESMSEGSACEISQAYVDARPEINLLVVDWSHWSQGNYYSVAAPSTEPVGLALGPPVLNLLRSGLPLPSLHVIGFSLGAHIAGTLGCYLQGNGFQLPRITALDPASPDFGKKGPLRTISSADAKFLDVIHTNSAMFGLGYQLGHVDFWPNAGTTQPGYVRDTTDGKELYESHNRSWKYYAESVRNPTAFSARRARSYLAFLTSRREDDQLVCMGPDCDVRASGNYYLRTNATMPYSMGAQGVEHIQN